MKRISTPPILSSAFLICLAACFFLSASVLAQERVITGTVKSVEDQSVVAGVNIVVKGTTIGTISSGDGSYSLNVPEQAETLIFTFIGLAPKEVLIGNQSVIDVAMETDIKQLSELVVTAFGLEREKKALGYAVQEVKGEDIAKTPTSSVVNNLSGKVAGLQVATNAVPGGSPEFVLRGFSSVSGNNQPLVVVDGVPIAQTVNSRNLTSSEDVTRNDPNFNRKQNQQYGGGISEIDPSNIASISVLKGPSAAALYGSRAANGVILITTKSGASGKKGIGAEVNFSATFEEPLVKPKFQNTYGGGSGYLTWYADGWSGTVDGFKGSDGTDESWGSPMDGRLVRHWWSGKETAPLVPEPNNWEQWWETGKTFNTNVSITGNNEFGSFRFSAGQLKQDGIVYNNDYYRNNFRLNASYNFTDKLKVTVSGEYVKSGSDNRAFSSSSNFIWHHRHTNFNQLKNYRQYESVHIQPPGDTEPPNWQHTFFSNPYFEQEVTVSPNEKDRFLGNVAVSYQLTTWLSVLARTGTDLWTDTRIVVDRYARTKGGSFRAGRYSEEVLRNQESNSDFILKADKEFKDFSLVVQLGGIHRTNYFKSNYTRVNELTIDRVYNLGNNASPNLNESAIAESEMNSLFSAVTLGYKNVLFLDVTGRNDWSSTLPKENNSFFYPSAALSAVVSEMVPSMFNNVISFLKLRGSWAKVGSDAPPYYLQQVYNPKGLWNGSIPKFSESSQIYNKDLKPEYTTGVEVGADIRFLNGRIGLDINYYDQATKDQILAVDISRGSGYTGRILNAGKITNKGIEISLSGTLLKFANGLTWDASVNFAKNENEVVTLADGLNSLVLWTQRGASLEARVGQPYGNLYGNKFARTEDGQLIFRNGYPYNLPGQHVIGNITPEWTGGVLNAVSFKGITVSALIDIKKGGDIYDMGSSLGRQNGVLEESLDGREEGVIGLGVKNIGSEESPNFVPNDVVASTRTFMTYYSGRQYHEAAIMDGSYVKLREASITYTLPAKWFDKNFLQSISISAVGRNLAIFHKNARHIDPEVSSADMGFNSGQLPSTRSIGFNVNVKF
ncbi:SusC/RagA family TonB-linked outer membrane protein [Chryseolinea sp. H1M3-3]|uniref:SusC/RagA family TonB-linked outer membrane protein n=1 Tax=Chryseolinea sp. H1M3-3 TaxID=3034144 RepID=UPI0023EAF4DC|nr:SusC/RagA family TonB-linked outer membrane protein [Chryseolinea sp. H1M3-3]